MSKNGAVFKIDGMSNREVVESSETELLKKIIDQHLDEKLQALWKLDKLDRLAFLTELQQLDKIEGLTKLEHLDQLQKLERLDQLGNLKNLDSLQALDKLNHLLKLKNLDKLSLLDKLDGLDKIENLGSLDKLDNLIHLQSLKELNKLNSLTSLNELVKLDELKHLEKLDNMQDLSKLDCLKEPKVQTALNGLEKLSFFEGSGKLFVIKLAASIATDFLKIFIISFFLFFLFTKNISRQTFDRLLPYLGFGEADRVNIALSILSRDLSSGDFDVHFKNLGMRVRREASSVFDAKVTKNLDHYRLLENLTSYNFKQKNYDLNALAQSEINTRASKIENKFNETYFYDLEDVAETAETRKDLDHFRKASIFIKQQKFLEGFVELNQIKNKSAFESIGYGMTFSFYMAFKTKPAELKLYLEK